MHRRKKKQSASNGLWRSVRGKLIGGSWAVVMVVIIYFVVRFITATNASESAAQAATINSGQLMQVVLPDNLKSVRCHYRGFTSHFNPDFHIPNVVIYELTVDEADGTLPRYKNFITDDRVEGCATPDDYSYSGYDRGHMAPAGDMKWDKDAMRESFYMTNICPQAKSLNTGAWNKLESRVREWAKRDSALIVASGPILGDSMPTIGDSKVTVPPRFFKILLASHAVPPRAIAFIYDNARATGSLEQHAVSVDVVEEATGIDFFSALPDEVEDAIEAQCDFRQWEQRKN